MPYVGAQPTTVSFPTDTFNGTGSQTAFTLQLAPASTNSIIVAVSGVVQDPATYSVSGTTLTFSAAPPSGTGNISVRFLGVPGIPNTPTAGSITNTSFANTLSAIPMQSGTLGAGNSSSMKNRLINGAMVIDQRNAGASVTALNTAPYTVDRFYALSVPSSKYTVQQNAGSVTPPAGFTNYAGITSTSAYSIASTDYMLFRQVIEGYNIADLGYGTANAKTVTLSFWVRSSLTGTFGGSLSNTSSDYSYPFSYTISSANTWEYKTITIAGPTSGTWNTTNGVGIAVTWSLGTGSTYSGTAGAWAAGFYGSATGATSVVGTNGATLYITGVQLEVGSTATSFDYRPYGTELQLCQRYYEKSYPVDTVPGTSSVSGASWWFVSSSTSGYIYGTVFYRVTKRTAATITFYSYTGTAGQASDGNVANIGAVGIRGQNNVQQFCAGNDTGGTVTPAGGNVNVHWTSDAEL